MSYKVPLLRVSQWLTTWDEADWENSDLPRPSKYFFIGSIKITTLRQLAGVRRRNIEDRKSGERLSGYQRAHQEERSKNIFRYLQYGYPLSNQLSLNPIEHKNLIHPGWLPTSILVNVIGEKETRRRAGKDLTVDPNEVIRIEERDGAYSLTIPMHNEARSPSSIEPLEIIDGQHRLFALDEFGFLELDGDYEVPVVFFDGLSESWQAYLFWVINVEPKKINPSLAYDLYPELRSQSWLERGETVQVYREHRAQELTEVLWRHEKSPWRGRIELHGRRVEGHVSNAAFIRSLMASFVRRWGNENRIGGLFGSIDKDGVERVLPWKRSQQAAFLIVCWQMVERAVRLSNAEWVVGIKNKDKDKEQKNKMVALDLAFSGPTTLLATDQGVRSILFVFNAICQVLYADLKLEEWDSQLVSDNPNDEDVTLAIAQLLDKKEITEFLLLIAEELIEGVDWRTSSSKSLGAEDRQKQAAYRGSAGYSLLQLRCLESLVKSENTALFQAADSIRRRII